jgi:hypothetical protein
LFSPQQAIAEQWDLQNTEIFQSKDVASMLHGTIFGKSKWSNFLTTNYTVNIETQILANDWINRVRINPRSFYISRVLHL